MSLRLRSLFMRLRAQREDLATCTTAAMRKCVEGAIADTLRQIAECEAATAAGAP